MNSLLSRAFGSAGASSSGTGRGPAWAPTVESFYHNNNLIVRVWIPGVDASEVDVKISGNLLAIKGERKFNYRIPENQYCLARLATDHLSEPSRSPTG